MNDFSFKRRIILVIGSIITSFAFSIATLYFPLCNRLDFNDSSIYQYIGYSICNGKIPYVDVFDHKGIYFYFINALGYLINPIKGMYPLIWVAMFFNVIVIYHSARKFFGIEYSVIIVLLLVSSMACTSWNGNIPDFFAMPFVLGAFDKLIDYFQNKYLLSKDVLFASVCTTLAFWMKPNMVLSTILFCIYISVQLVISQNLKFVINYIAVFIIGFIMTSLPAILWLYFNSGLFDMIEDYFLYSLKYAGFHTTIDLQINAFSTFVSYPISVLTLVFILIWLISLLKKKVTDTEINHIFSCGVISFVICLIHVSLTGNAYTHYMMLLYPPILLIIIGFALLTKGVFTGNGKCFVILLLLSIVVIGMNIKKEYLIGKYFMQEVPEEDLEVRFIIDNSNETDTIAVISPQYTGFYLASNRQSATKYIYVQSNHFTNLKENPEEEEEFWNEYTASLLKSKPRVIVYDTGYNGNDDFIKGVLNKCLKEYTYAGASLFREFYILPNSEEEIIPSFQSQFQKRQEKNSFEITIPKEMLEAYREGKITIDDFLEYYDTQIMNIGD